MSSLLRRGIQNPGEVPRFVRRNVRRRWRVIANRVPPRWTWSDRDFEGVLTVEPHPEVDQPALDGSEVDDFSAAWVADPFLAYEGDTYYLFAEAAKESYPENGACLVWYESDDGLDWSYGGVAVDVEPESDMTDSYPQVVDVDGTWYLVPSFARGSGVDDFRIYEFENFPTGLELTETPIRGIVRGDPTLFEWDGRWYCVFEDSSHHLRLFHASSFLGGEWTEHPRSPIEAERKLRPGGRPVVREDGVDFFTQGPLSNRTSLLYHRITTVSPEEFRWHEVGPSPITYPASHPGDWNELNMHHLDYLDPGGDDRRIVAVDGQNRRGEYAIGIYRVAPGCDY